MKGLPLAVNQTAEHPWLAATERYLQQQGRPFTAVDLAEEMLRRFDAASVPQGTHQFNRLDVPTSEITALFGEGVPKREIARRLGVTPTCVRLRLAAVPNTPTTEGNA